MYCKQCGNELKPTDAFCLMCGTPVMVDRLKKHDDNMKGNIVFGADVQLKLPTDYNEDNKKLFVPHVQIPYDGGQDEYPCQGCSGGAVLGPRVSAKKPDILSTVVTAILTCVSVFCIYGVFFFDLFIFSDDNSYSLIKIGELLKKYGKPEMALIMIWISLGIAALTLGFTIFSLINTIRRKHKKAFMLLTIVFSLILLDIAALAAVFIIFKSGRLSLLSSDLKMSLLFAVLGSVTVLGITASSLFRHRARR